MDEDGPLIQEEAERVIGKKIMYFDEVSSTNVIAKELALHNEEEGTVVVAKLQSDGRGRFGKAWSSMNQDGIWLSIILRPQGNEGKIEILTILFAVCIVQALKAVANVQCSIKWPNDVIIKGRKVSGIICERITNGEEEFVIVGIGINVNQESFEEELSAKAISLKILTGEVFSKKSILYELLTYADKMYSSFLNNDLNELFLLYKKYSMMSGKEISLIRKEQELKCTVIDVNSDGHLVVMHKDGEIEEVFSGEVSVSGVYGFV